MGGDSTRATDKLIMEDGRDSVSADDITEKQILKSKPRDSLLTDAEYLVIYYSGQSGGIATTFQEWKNNVAQRYENAIDSTITNTLSRYNDSFLRPTMCYL